MTSPSLVRRDTSLSGSVPAPPSTHQISPFGAAVIPVGRASVPGAQYSWTSVPPVFTAPALSLMFSVNQRLPSRPATMS